MEDVDIKPGNITAYEATHRRQINNKKNSLLNQEMG
jgi:hypothetical protein